MTAAPLYILSFRQRDELAQAASTAGWHAVASRRADDAERRFIASRACVAVVDARGAAQDGLAAVRTLGPVARSRRAALLALVSRGDTELLAALIEAGATHFLVSRFDDAELAAALRAAQRHADRLAGREAGDSGVAYLGAELRRAIDAREIEMRFQPQVEMASGRIVGVEALMRWPRPDGAVGAERLLLLAEQAGLATALSEAAQQAALTAAAAWPDGLAALRLSINVTAEDVAARDFVARLLARVDASRFPRERLTVEVTESGLIEDLDRASERLGELRAAGLRVAIDDFGTGYSSLAYLKALPLDYLKIDRALAQDIAGSARDRVIVEGVIAMARSLGLATVAEGVETEEQRSRLAEQGCSYFQGFLCAEPLDTAGLAALVAGQGR